MSLVLRSSTPERHYLHERHPDGRERIGVAESDPTFGTNGAMGGERWNIQITHPDGMIKRETVFGSRLDANLKMISLLEDTRRDFVEAGKRGDQQPYVPDSSRSVEGTHGVPRIRKSK